MTSSYHNVLKIEEEDSIWNLEETLFNLELIPEDDYYDDVFIRLIMQYWKLEY